MHRLDSKLLQLDTELASAEEALVADDEVASLKRAIAARESQLMPLYVQISHEFADLHDRPGRMKAKGVIRDVVGWEGSRAYFAMRVRRRLAQDALVKELRGADASLSHAEALGLLKGWMGGDEWEDDKAAMAWFTDDSAAIAEKIAAVRAGAVKKAVGNLLSGLPAGMKDEVLADLA